MSIDTDLARALMAFLATRRGDSGQTRSETLTSPWSQNPFVRSGVGAIYRVVKGIPCVAVSGKRDDEKSWKELPTTHPLSLLLATPYRGVYGSEAWAQLVAIKKLEGHAYALLYGPDGLWDRDSGQWPRAMQAINPRSVTFRDTDVDATGSVSRWLVTDRRGVQREVPAGAMMHLRDFDPIDPILCTSPLAPVWLGMEADLNVDAYAQAWLRNVGAIGTWLQSKSDITDDQKRAILAAFREAYGGAGNAGKTFLSGPDLDVKPGPAAQTARDMEMPRLREWNRDAVKAVLGVTDYEVGRIADYNRANAEASRKWLIENTILPELEALEAAFWGHVGEPVSRRERADTWARFKVESLPIMQASLGETATTARTLIETGFDPVQVSERLNLGLDFVDIVDPTTPPPPPPEPAKTGLTIIIRKAARAVKPLSRAAALRVHAAWARHAERKLGVRWRKFTAARYADTIRIVRNLTDLGPVDAIMGSPETWRAGAQAAAEGGLRGVGPAVSDNLRAELGGFARIDAGQSAYEAAAARRVGQMVDVGMRLRTSIRDTITRTMLDAPQDLETLERVVREKFGGRLPSNAATVARTETGIFASDVRRNLMVAEGVDEHEWSASLDVHTRETHRAVDGERRPIDQRFSNGLLHPLETGAPAGEVVNCRCLELPYMREVDD